MCDAWQKKNDILPHMVAKNGDESHRIPIRKKSKKKKTHPSVWYIYLYRTSTIDIGKYIKLSHGSFGYVSVL